MPPPEQTHALYSNMLRRLHRIFAHAGYYHREHMAAFEARRALCARFVQFGLRHGLLSRKHLLPDSATVLSGGGGGGAGAEVESSGEFATPPTPPGALATARSHSTSTGGEVGAAEARAGRHVRGEGGLV